MEEDLSILKVSSVHSYFLKFCTIMLELGIYLFMNMGSSLTFAMHSGRSSSSLMEKVFLVP